MRYVEKKISRIKLSSVADLDLFLFSFIVAAAVFLDKQVILFFKFIHFRFHTLIRMTVVLR